MPGWIENTDLENADLENTDVENVVCVLIEKLRPFTPNGTTKFNRAPNYHWGRFKIINKLTLTEISKMADALRISDSVFFSDCKWSFRLQKIEFKITWNFIKLGIPIQYKIKQ